MKEEEFMLHLAKPFLIENLILEIRKEIKIINYRQIRNLVHHFSSDLPLVSYLISVSLDGRRMKCMNRAFNAGILYAWNAYK